MIVEIEPWKVRWSEDGLPVAKLLFTSNDNQRLSILYHYILQLVGKALRYMKLKAFKARLSWLPEVSNYY